MGFTQTDSAVPLTIIRPSRGWAALNLRELWRYRELFYFLIWRDLKVRYTQTFLGVLWAVIQPLFMMFIFTLFFGKLAHVPSDGIPYPIFAYAGLLPWMFFANAAINSGNSLIVNPSLITKVYFPRLIIPSAAVGAGLVDFFIAFVILAPLMLYYQIKVTLSILMLPVLVVLTTLLALAIGILMSALNVKYRDIRYALPFLIQLWMFATPIIYPSSLILTKWRWIFALNPLAGIIEGYRAALLGKRFDWVTLCISGVITVVLFVYSAYAFRRMEKSFSDII